MFVPHTIYQYCNRYEAVRASVHLPFTLRSPPLARYTAGSVIAATGTVVY